MNVVRRVSKRGKRRIIAQGLDAHDADWDSFPPASLDFVHHPRLRVPFVAAHPGSKDPSRGTLGPAGALQEGGEHLGWRTLPQPEADGWIRLARIEGCLDPEAHRIRFAAI